jgi:hypothetical protein
VASKTPEEKLNNATERSLRLFTDFLQLQERYALLHPMLFDESVQWQYGHRHQWHGFDAMRRSLFFSCCQDIYKLSCDRARNHCVSIDKCMDDLNDHTVYRQLKASYIAAELAIDEGHPDPVVAAIDVARVSERTASYSDAFDRKCDEATASWKEFLTRPTLKACDTIRNEMTAHTRLQLISPTLDPIDITKLDIDLNDLKPTISAMQGLVSRISGVVRAQDFAWQHNEQRYIRAAMNFWQDKNGC